MGGNNTEYTPICHGKSPCQRDLTSPCKYQKPSQPANFFVRLDDAKFQVIDPATSILLRYGVENLSKSSNVSPSNSHPHRAVRGGWKISWSPVLRTLQILVKCSHGSIFLPTSVHIPCTASSSLACDPSIFLLFAQHCGLDLLLLFLHRLHSPELRTWTVSCSSGTTTTSPYPRERFFLKMKTSTLSSTFSTVLLLAIPIAAQTYSSCNPLTGGELEITNNISGKSC